MIIQKHGVKELVLDSMVFSVSQLNYTVKSVLENSEYLLEIYVKGEISNFKRLASGNAFFTLKEKNSSVKCFMKRVNADEMDESIKDGDEVVVRGSVSVYQQRGEYCLDVEDLYKQGVGDLHRKFLELKAKLEKEGLFDDEKKRSIPLYPESIGVVASAAGVVAKDIVDTVKRRYPLARVVLSPAAVQGESAAESIMLGIERLEERNVDVIIVARGGGSLEDLWCFNDEFLARKIFSCSIPVVTGIGHESDFTIADFVADLRAPTPSIAAERATPDKQGLLRALDGFEDSLLSRLKGFVGNTNNLLESYEYKLRVIARSLLRDRKEELDLLAGGLQGFNVKAVLKRGFCVALKKGRTIRDKGGVCKGDTLVLLLGDGSVKVKVVEVE